MSLERVNVIGVLIAAGRGRRMRTLKQLLPWDDSTIIESAFDGLAPFCGAGMVVVLGAEADRIAGTLAPRTFTRVDSDPDAEMFESVKHGFQAASESTATHILLHPADHPVVPHAVVERLLRETKEKALIPTHHGKGGHPAVIPSAILPEIFAWRGVGGLRAFWEESPDVVERIEFPDAPELTLDLDTRAQYNAARRGGT